MENNLIDYNQILKDIKSIISTGLNAAYSATNRAIVLTYWHIGNALLYKNKMGKNELNMEKHCLTLLQMN